MTIDEQAREYAAKTLAEDKEAVAHDWEMGFKAGAHRTPSDAELEEAAKALYRFYSELRSDASWNKLPKSVKECWRNDARYIARALGHEEKQ